jgi:hypothetical protein
LGQGIAGFDEENDGKESDHKSDSQLLPELIVAHLTDETPTGFLYFPNPSISERGSQGE